MTSKQFGLPKIDSKTHCFFDRFFHPCFFDFLSFFFQKSTKILPKIDSKMHHIFDRFLHRFCFDLGSQLGALLITFSLKIRQRYLREGWFMLGLSSFSVFWPSWPPLGALWARFGRVRASILEVFGTHFLHNFQSLGSHFFSNLSPVLKHLLH